MRRSPIAFLTGAFPSRSGLRAALILTALGLAGSCHAVAEEATEAPRPPKWIVTAECRMIVVSESRMLALMPELLDDARIEAAGKKLETMIAKGEAKLAANLLVKADAGTRGVAESVREFRYPSQFRAPDMPYDLPKENPLEVLKAWPAVAITPTDFQARNIGATMQFDSVIRASGARIYVNVVPEHVRFLRWDKFDAGVLANGKRLTVDQPQFFTTKTTFSMEFRNGQMLLVGVHKLIEPEGSFELVLLRVSARQQKDAK